MSSGARQTTGNPLDVAIDGDGFFQIGEGQPTTDQSPIAATSYTRAGNFSISTDGFLTTQSGQYVIGYHQPEAANPDGVAIKIPKGATGVAVDQTGGVSYVDPDTSTRVTPYRLTIATFPNSSGLERSGGNQWVASANSGAPTINTPGIGGAGSTSAGSVEMSNVDLSSTFTNMITAQRGFQANSRVISTADSMLEELVNLKR